MVIFLVNLNWDFVVIKSFVELLMVRLNFILLVLISIYIWMLWIFVDYCSVYCNIKMLLLI